MSYIGGRTVQLETNELGHLKGLLQCGVNSGQVSQYAIDGIVSFSAESDVAVERELIKRTPRLIGLDGGSHCSPCLLELLDLSLLDLEIGANSDGHGTDDARFK